MLCTQFASWACMLASSLQLVSPAYRILPIDLRAQYHARVKIPVVQICYHIWVTICEISLLSYDNGVEMADRVEYRSKASVLCCFRRPVVMDFHHDFEIFVNHKQ